MKKKANPPQQTKGKDISSKETQGTTASEGPAACDAIKDSSQEKMHLRLSKTDSCFLKFLNEDRQKLPSFCDITVTVCEKMYRAHKVVLAFGSGYFHAKFSENPELQHVTIDNTEVSTFEHLLNFLYTSEFDVSESQIPALAETACFLDMMEAVNLLAKWATPAHVDEESDVLQVPAETPDAQTSAGAQCSFCSRTFCYKKSLENHLAKTHSAGCQVEEEQNMASTSAVTTRRSARQRRTPAKFESRESVLSGKPGQKSLKDDAAAFEEEEEDDESEEEQQNDQEEQSSKEGREETVEEAECEDGEKQEEEHVAERSKALEQTEAQEENEPTSSRAVEEHSQATEVTGHVFPEGLAPVIIQSTNKKTLKCPKCEKTFDRIGKYESHTRVHTGEKPFQCDICLQCYSTKSNLTVHKKKHDSDSPVQRKEHKCPFCNKLHASKKTLSRHVKRFHPDHLQEFLSQKKKKSEGWKCDICHKTFSRRPHLEEHMILHSQDKPFKCAYCDDYFKSRFARLKHQEKFHLGPFPCDICGRQFNDTGNRKRHIECTHGGKRKWTCFLCGKSVRERTTLREHLRIHSGEKPHLCSICGQSFRHGSSYRLHLRVHHEDKRYECDECGKTFIRHDHLKKHKKIHTGERAHQCEECGKCFRRADHLTVHYKSIHLGEKIWRRYKAVVHQCQVCKKDFRGKTNLVSHFRTHSGEKPHRCVICNQTFRIKKTLTKHMVIHSDVRPFNCPHCSASFKRKDKLKYHVDHVHSGRPLEQQQPNLSAASKLTEPLPSNETPKAYHNTPKTVLQSVAADICVPVTLVPVQMTEESHLAVHGTVSQQQQTGYQSATDLVFLEKYTLTPQPTNIVHPVRPEQMLDPREQSYLGTLLGLDSATAVQNMSSAEHTH
ncbi:zinc finger and BTB domain-containing protein 41 isoform X2 [Sinocyclocheilus grahami]|uniref:zinc finger and BTB domain-containing protein 41 isoform X1 n=1 Tax=Sinocyclocheilus grahami TaxID=75366 RepID=UPI0007AC96C5|nr:PREDICTED: zinc finger and BTB domain-containing protein 41 isoform X1 [Sinocyclocheilus grahami]XP_016139126.1 PREDICTED: zinc finger and BTB domain-containing protein 41 isoform X1 [Sinocyclocheilus grahami]XP_016139127.1 PREDICTED: zinc finger and BTB domain-containing protein 41 isoform X2 [Sinocyclocheilus grahami]